MDQAVDDGFLKRYRALLDAEEAAFDALEHATEDGDRETYEHDLEIWRNLAERRAAFLAEHQPVPATVQR